MAKQAGARFPYGLGRASRARAGRNSTSTATFSCTRWACPQGAIPAACKLRNAGTILFSRQRMLSPRRIVAPTPAREASAILRDADEICAHRFRLLGYENLDFGSEIDWHLDPVHGKRAPLDPWFKIPFLDFAAVGDHKVIWELNRHQHLVTLAKAQLLSGNKNDKCVRELTAQWRSWTNANPYPLGINWGSTLEVAFRSLSWIWVDQSAGGNGRAYEDLPRELLAGARLSRPLHRALSIHLFFSQHASAGRSGCDAFSRHSVSANPKRRALERVGLENCAARSAAPGSSRWRLFRAVALLPRLRARLLPAMRACSRREMDGEIPPAYDVVLQRMLDVVEALAQAGPGRRFRRRRRRPTVQSATQPHRAHDRPAGLRRDDLSRRSSPPRN